ncbi:MAG: NAD(+)/NADH kinase [bacterium]
MNKIGIITKPDKKGLANILSELITWLEKKNKEIFIEKETLTATNIDRKGYDREKIPELVDMLLVLGGDGTFLSAARLINKKNSIPLLGVNLGSLGFLTETSLTELYITLENIFNNMYVIEKRIMLDITMIPIISEYNDLVALNELAICKVNPNRTIGIIIHIDNKYVNTFKADGLIISTPTGSTAYSLSAGGPIIFPDLNVFVITPICSHTLSTRPIVISGDSEIEIKLENDHNQASVSIDGQISIPFEHNNKVKVKRSSVVVNFLQSQQKNYYEILRTKLNWGRR